MNKPETWVEFEHFVNSHQLGPNRYNDGSHGLRGDKGSQRRTEKLVEGRWLVRWWRRIA